jgi:hypothetical protein
VDLEHELVGRKGGPTTVENVMMKG